MFEKLREKYAHALTSPGNTEESLFIIQNDQGEKLYFNNTRLTKEEKSLLSTLFDQVEPELNQPVSASYRMWTQLLLHNQLPDKDIFTPVRFIHFHVKGSLTDIEGFTEAVNSLFSSIETLLWPSPGEGVVIQRLDEEFDDEQLDDSAVSALTSDFYVQLSFLVGSPHTSAASVRDRFKLEMEMFKAARNYSPSQTIFHEQEALSHWLLSNLEHDVVSTFRELLKPVQNDRELQQSVKTYLECNLNTSMAAKKMFVHRNTLQYRVEKFIEKTSLDIKQFPNAVAVYLMLLVQNSKKANHDR
ncbi:PucR family transcriptional regulator [Alteribacter keqinensis]|uniref:PucR C-terminal helix-turn-helix domain-containing protein n=1 Tax=Alteribacter keqinensis TaxID=2483800 RepID=A0A3M7TTX6_9BACI|nr:helix-turn-helix domain-containing protein [Alteribacter keqinensis]RNA68681.1 hypothetical protein EBO34_01550 [Alteribacter keqinensis]